MDSNTKEHRKKKNTTRQQQHERSRVELVPVTTFVRGRAAHKVRVGIGTARGARPPTRKRNCCAKPIVRCPIKSLSSCPLLSQPFRRGLLALAIVYGTVAGVESEGFGGAWDRGGRLDNGGPPGLVRFGVIVSPTLPHIETRTGYCNLGLAMLG